MKDIKDYLPYYVGSPVFLCNNLEGNPVIEPLISKMLHEDEEMFTDPENGPYRLMLRRLSDMTDIEAIQLTKLVAVDSEFNNVSISKNSFGDRIISWDYDQYNVTAEVVWSAEQFHYLLKQGFDLFGLIDAGAAIDAKTLNQPL